MILGKPRSLPLVRFILAILSVFLPAGLIAQQNYTYVSINYPGASSGTFPYAVNDSGKVVGLYVNGDGSYHGFYWDDANYTSIDYPGAGATTATGINNAGTISGYYETDQGSQVHGFILENGSFTSYDYPGFAGQTIGEGINNHGETVGYYSNNSGGSDGFFNNNGSFSSFSYPGGCWTVAYGLNDSEQAAGYYRSGCSTSVIGFFYSNGTFTSIEYPDDYQTQAGGINNAGVVTGWSYTNDPPYEVGWTWQNGSFVAIPDANKPLPNGINNNGQLVGIYASGGGFLATPTTASQPSQFVPIVPCRVVDTRNPDGTFGGPPISGGSSRSFPLPQGSCSGIPASATAYALNVTLVPINHHRVGYLTIWPTGQSQPGVSLMNSDGRTKADAATVPAGTGGAVSVYVTDTTNVILDIDGYYITPENGTLQFYPLPPCRVADTRSTQYPQGLGAPFLTGQVARNFPVLNNTTCIPSNVNALAYSFNLTAIPYQSSPMGYLEVWPTGNQPPDPVSTLNNPNAVTVANAAVVPAGSGGEITVYPSANTNLAIDINGYFARAGSGLSLYTVPPCRVLDTRNNNGQPFSGTLNPPVNVANSNCGIPGSAGAYVFNATVIPAPTLGYLTL